MAKKNARDLHAYLNDLANKFHAQFISERGWGQFLDGSIANTQVGLYGTCAGALVLYSAGRNHDVIPKAVTQTLLSYWNDDTGRGAMIKSQVLRLAMLYLGLRAISDPPHTCLHDIRNRLLEARIPGTNMWGDYWLDGSRYSGAPKVFVTSFALICLCILDPSDEITPELRSTGIALQNAYLSDVERHVPYEQIVFAGLSLTLGQAIDGRVKRRMRSRAHNALRIGERFRYYYDFKDAENIDRRDYFIVPIEISATLIINSNHIPSNYVLRGISAADHLIHDLDRTGGLYCPEIGDRVSTLEQGFAALALKVYGEFRQGVRRRTISDILYGLSRHRDAGEWILNCLLIIAYLVFLIILTVDHPDAPFPAWLQATLLTILAAIKNPKDLAKEALHKTK